MTNKQINLRCAKCGCDRGGVIDLKDKDAKLLCFECNANQSEAGSTDAASVQ